MNTRQTGNNYKIMKLPRYGAMCNLRGINNPFACSSLKSRLKRTLVAVWCGENHWRAKRWTFWLITRPAPNANFQIITVFSMAAVAVGYSALYTTTKPTTKTLYQAMKTNESNGLNQPSMVSYDMIFEHIGNTNCDYLARWPSRLERMSMNAVVRLRLVHV